jgi:hypothetical protein
MELFEMGHLGFSYVSLGWAVAIARLDVPRWVAREVEEYAAAGEDDGEAESAEFQCGWCDKCGGGLAEQEGDEQEGAEDGESFDEAQGPRGAFDGEAAALALGAEPDGICGGHGVVRGDIGCEGLQ